MCASSKAAFKSSKGPLKAERDGLSRYNQGEESVGLEGRGIESRDRFSSQGRVVWVLSYKSEKVGPA